MSVLLSETTDGRSGITRGKREGTGAALDDAIQRADTLMKV